MKASYAIAFAVLSGLCGAAAVEGLHAQTKARKAYTVSELQTLDAKLAADVATRITKAQELSGGHNFRTGGGKVTVLEGPTARPHRDHGVGEPGEGTGILRIKGLERAGTGP